MTDRYALRFESGDRAGETIPISGRGLSLGRRPGSSVQILDASVSGRHAEISVDESGVTLRDLGSTNGTRVGDDRVSERVLAHGDRVVLGNVEMTFLDGEVGGEPPAPSPSTAGGHAAAGEEVHTITAEKVARSRKRPLAALLVLLILAGGAAAAWYYLGKEGGPGPQRAVNVIEPVAGNLLETGYSFEQVRGGWTDDEGSPAGFESDPAAAHSGEIGLRAELGADAGAWSLARSIEVRVSAGRTLVARGWLAAEGDAEALLGIELTSSSGATSSVVAWSPPATDAGEVELRVDVPSVYDGARALILGRLRRGLGSGAVDADDVSLVGEPSAGDGGRPKLGETELYTSGTLGLLYKIDRTLLSDLALFEGAGDGPATPRAQLSGAGEDNGVRLKAPAAGPGVERRLSLFVEPALATGGVATTGEAGYRTHQAEFEREGADALLFGSGRDLVRLVLTSPARVTGRPEADGYRIEAHVGAAADALLQLSFRAERDAAEDLARNARAAERAARPGDAIAGWQELLDRYPFESALVEEATGARARLEQVGLEEVGALREAVVRARFFRLVDLFRQCRDEARALATRYAPSDVAVQAGALADEVETDLVDLESQLDESERLRLQAIERALRAAQATKLADRVGEQLRERFGGGDT